LENLQKSVFARERPSLVLSSNCVADHMDDRLVNKCVGNGGGAGISDVGGGGGGEETDGENVC